MKKPLGKATERAAELGRAFNAAGIWIVAETVNDCRGNITRDGFKQITDYLRTGKGSVSSIVAYYSQAFGKEESR